MKSFREQRVGLLAGAVALVLVAATPAAVAVQQDDGLHLVQEVAGSDQDPMTMEMWIQGETMRTDLGDRMSVIFEGGDASRTTFVQHEQKTYMVWTKEEMERMQEMMSRFGGRRGMQGAQQAPDAGASGTPPTFRRTGNTQQIGDWSCYEVVLEGPSVEGDVAMWFTEDLEVGWLDVVGRMGKAMSSLSQNPMMQAQQGSFGDVMQRMQQARSQWESMDVDMPEGYPVRIESRRPDGSETTITVKEIELGPVPASTFQPPGGYQKMDMPQLGR